MKDKVIAEDLQFEDLEISPVNKEKPSEMSSSPCLVSSPLNLSPKKASHSVQSIPLSLPYITSLPTTQSSSILPNIPTMAG